MAGTPRNNEQQNSPERGQSYAKKSQSSTETTRRRFSQLTGMGFLPQFLQSNDSGNKPEQLEAPEMMNTAQMDGTVQTSYYNVKNYGAAGDGESDDTGEIQTAIDDATADGGGVVFLPVGVYAISDTLSITDDDVGIVGVGQGSVVKCTFAEGDVIHAGGPESSDAVSNAFFRDFSIVSSVEKTSGAAIFCEHAERFRFHNVKAAPQTRGTRNLYDGFYFRYYDSCLLSNVYGICRHKAVTLYGKSDQTWGAGMWIGNGSRFLTPFQDSTGIHIGGSSGGIAVEDTDIIANERNVVIDEQLSGEFNREIFLNQCFLDVSASHGLDFGGAIGSLQLNNTWIASSGRPDHPVLMGRVDPDDSMLPGHNFNFREEAVGSILVDGCQIFNARGSGIVASGGEWDITGCSVHHNGLGTEGGRGIALLDSAVDNALVAGNLVVNNGPSNVGDLQGRTGSTTETTSEYGVGIYVDESVDHYLLVGNVARENTSAQITERGGPTKVVGHNLTVASDGEPTEVAVTRDDDGAVFIGEQSNRVDLAVESNRPVHVRDHVPDGWDIVGGDNHSVYTEDGTRYVEFRGAVYDETATYVAKAPGGLTDTNVYTFGPVEFNDGSGWTPVGNTADENAVIGHTDPA